MSLFNEWSLECNGGHKNEYDVVVSQQCKIMRREAFFHLSNLSHVYLDIFFINCNISQHEFVHNEMEDTQIPLKRLH